MTLRRTLAVVLSIGGSLALPACTPRYGLDDLDGLVRQTHAQTVLVRGSFTLFAALDAADADEAARCVDQALVDTTGAFGVAARFDPPVAVLVEPAGSRADPREPTRTLPAHYGGTTGDARQVLVLFQTPWRGDHAATFEATVRHELAHVVLLRQEPRLRHWIGEGLATAVQFAQRRGDGTLAILPDPKLMGFAQRSRQASLADLLAWNEKVGPDLLYALAHAWTHFLLQRTGGTDLRTALGRLERFSDAQLLGLAPEWRRWIDAGPRGLSATPRTAAPDQRGAGNGLKR